MEDDLILRQQAVELHLNGVPVSDIVQKLGRSRQWVHKWITRYRTEGRDDWYLSRSTSPKQVRNRTPPKEEDLVINVRKALAGLRYSTQGGKTPNQIKTISEEHKLKPINLEDPIPLIDGSVIFIRFIRSDRSLTILRTRFTVKKELIYTYIVAEIVIDQHVLLVKQDGIIHHVFPFAMPVD